MFSRLFGKFESGQSGLNEEHDNLKKLETAIRTQGEKIAYLEIRMNEMKNELKSELKREIKSVTTTTSEATFKFELTEVSKFFEAIPMAHDSEKVWCRGFQWSIKAKCSLAGDGSKRLEIYLNSHNDDPQEWSCKVECKLTLFSHLSETSNFVGYIRNTFDRVSCSWGYAGFISHRELIDPKYGYIKNDKLVLGVELKAEPVVRG